MLMYRCLFDEPPSTLQHSPGSLDSPHTKQSTSRLKLLSKDLVCLWQSCFYLSIVFNQSALSHLTPDTNRAFSTTQLQLADYLLLFWRSSLENHVDGCDVVKTPVHQEAQLWTAASDCSYRPTSNEIAAFWFANYPFLLSLFEWTSLE